VVFPVLRKNSAKTKDYKQAFVGEAGNVCLGKPVTDFDWRNFSTKTIRAGEIPRAVPSSLCEPAQPIQSRRIVATRSARSRLTYH
jgi:hypothetical protein